MGTTIYALKPFFLSPLDVQVEGWTEMILVYFSVPFMFLCPRRVAYIVITPSVLPSVQVNLFRQVHFFSIFKDTNDLIQLHNIIGFVKYLFPVGFWVNRSKVTVA